MAPADGGSQAAAVRAAARWAACALLVTSTGCTSAPEVTTGPEWASAAEEYAAALNDAYRVGITDAMRFYAPDAHVDKRFIDYEGVGRAGFAQALRDSAQYPPTWPGGRDNSRPDRPGPHRAALPVPRPVPRAAAPD